MFLAGRPHLDVRIQEGTCWPKLMPSHKSIVCGLQHKSSDNACASSIEIGWGVRTEICESGLKAAHLRGFPRLACVCLYWARAEEICVSPNSHVYTKTHAYLCDTAVLFLLSEVSTVIYSEDFAIFSSVHVSTWKTAALYIYGTIYIFASAKISLPCKTWDNLDRSLSKWLRTIRVTCVHKIMKRKCIYLMAAALRKGFAKV